MKKNPSLKNISKSAEGITLIALVVTIIVLLILAGISINMLSGENSILTQAGRARDLTAEAQIDEAFKLAVLGGYDTKGSLNAVKVKENIENQINGATVSGDDFPIKVTIEEKEYLVDKNGEINVVGDEELPDLSSFYVKSINERNLDTYYKLYTYLEIIGDPKEYNIYYLNTNFNKDELTYEVLQENAKIYNGEKVNCTYVEYDGDHINQYLYIFLAKNKSDILNSEILQFDIQTLCFAKSTLIATSNGKKNIEDIKIGDMVYSYNEKNKTIEHNKVLKTIKHNIKTNMCRISIGNDEIKCTDNHPIYTKNRGYIGAKNLCVGDVLINSKNEEVILKNSIKTEVKVEEVYNLEIENNHNYFVGKEGILVHNVPSQYAYCNEYSSEIYNGTSITLE